MVAIANSAVYPDVALPDEVVLAFLVAVPPARKMFC
jgi:hypothetical protein